VREYPAAHAAAKDQHDRQQQERWQQAQDERAGWRRTAETPSPPNQLPRKLKFDTDEFRQTFFKTKGYPSALDLLPYLDKIRAATFDPMHLVLIGLMKVFCKEIYIEGHYGGTEGARAKPKKPSKADKRKATATNDQLVKNRLGLDVAPSEADMEHLQLHLATESAQANQIDVAKRKELYAVLRSEDVHELTRMMKEVCPFA
jgi:hypothetical protein